MDCFQTEVSVCGLTTPAVSPIALMEGSIWLCRIFSSLHKRYFTVAIVRSMLFTARFGLKKIGLDEKRYAIDGPRTLFRSHVHTERCNGIKRHIYDSDARFLGATHFYDLIRCSFLTEVANNTKNI